MSFRLFIYYCALCGGWAAYFTWGIVHGGLDEVVPRERILMRGTLIAAILGALIAAAVGLVDSLQSAAGAQRLLRVLVCTGLGFIGGGIGGGIGQLLYDYLGVPRVVGWMLTGVLIGASIGAFDILRAQRAGQEVGAAVRKSLNGIYGGLIGGLIGGLPFSYLSETTTLPRSGQLISLVLLGSSIGLMIGLAQVVLKEAWVKVEEGFRSGREVMLNKEETTIGRAESCDLGLFADNTIEKLHASILRKNNRYLLAHGGGAGETLLNDRPVGGKPEPLRSGDRIRIGKSVLSFNERQKKKK